jgi:hypothetical protein
MQPTNERLVEIIMTEEFCRANGLEVPAALKESAVRALAHLKIRKLEPGRLDTIRSEVRHLVQNEVAEMLAVDQAQRARGDGQVSFEVKL